MHHSLLTTLMIDCLDSHFEESLRFWSGALGLKPEGNPAPEQRYVTLGRLPVPLTVCLQKVESNPGYHLDIETDDQRAERERMQTLGGKSKYHIRRWWVMQDPSGSAFCLVRPDDPAFVGKANQWPDD